MMNVIYQGTQLLQGTCDTEGSMVRKQLSKLPCQFSMCFQRKRKQALVLILSTYYYHKLHKNYKPETEKLIERGVCEPALGWWWWSNKDSHHSFIHHWLAPKMCEELNWSLEYSDTQDTVSALNKVTIGDRRYRNLWYMQWQEKSRLLCEHRN